MTAVPADRPTDEDAVRSANERLPPGYRITWDRDEMGRFCADLHAPSGLNLCGLMARPQQDELDNERERVLNVLVECAAEHAGR